MGDAERKKMSEKAFAMNRSKWCIYCGGNELATTADHCPPRAAFVDRKWPTGFIFPACEPCNNKASDAEKIFSFVAQFYPSDGNAAKSPNKYRIDTLRREYPQEFREMLGLTPMQKMRSLRSFGGKIPAGMLKKDIPIVRLPKAWSALIDECGRKILKAIHFHETGDICHNDGFYAIKFRPNVANWSNPIPEKVLSGMGRSHTIERTKRDLSDQFSYITQRSSDKSVAMYFMSFNMTFSILAIYGHKQHSTALESAFSSDSDEDALREMENLPLG